MKATDLMLEDRSAQASLHDHMDHFAKKWAPFDRRRNAEFQADFLCLVQVIHREAMKPMERAMTAAFSLTSIQSIISPGLEKDK